MAFQGGLSYKGTTHLMHPPPSGVARLDNMNSIMWAMGYQLRPQRREEGIRKDELGRGDGEFGVGDSLIGMPVGLFCFWAMAHAKEAKVQ